MSSTKRVVLANADGEVRVITPCSPRRPGETEQQWLDRIVQRTFAANSSDLGGFVRVADIEAFMLPRRRFRKSWRWSIDKIAPDADMARREVLDSVRKERIALLVESDGMRAKVEEIGTPQQRQAVTAYRKQLRDLPAVVEAEIRLLDVGSLEMYAPAWPAKPDV